MTLLLRYRFNTQTVLHTHPNKNEKQCRVDCLQRATQNTQYAVSDAKRIHRVNLILRVNQRVHT